MPSDLTLPTVHLNGTSRKMLAEGYQAAYTKLQETLRAFQSIEFNARDYYVQDDDAYRIAVHQRGVAFQKLCDARDYLEAHLIHLGE